MGKAAGTRRVTGVKCSLRPGHIRCHPVHCEKRGAGQDSLASERHLGTGS